MAREYRLPTPRYFGCACLYPMLIWYGPASPSRAGSSRESERGASPSRAGSSRESERGVREGGDRGKPSWLQPETGPGTRGSRSVISDDYISEGDSEMADGGLQRVIGDDYISERVLAGSRGCSESFGACSKLRMRN